jgi:hypothetical protein
LYNIERENLFEERFLVCKVAKRVRVHFQVVAYKEIVTFVSEWEVWKIFLQSLVSFSNVENSLFKFLKVSSFKVKVFGREFFKLLRISTLKFEKVCGREFFKLLRISTLKFEKVCGREFFKLLRISTLKFEKVCGRKFFNLLKV